MLDLELYKERLEKIESKLPTKNIHDNSQFGKNLEIAQKEFSNLFNIQNNHYESINLFIEGFRNYCILMDLDSQFYYLEIDQLVMGKIIEYAIKMEMDVIQSDYDNDKIILKWM